MNEEKNPILDFLENTFFHFSKEKDKFDKSISSCLTIILIIILVAFVLINYFL